MVFTDASALIAIIAGEADAAELPDLLEADRVRLCSAVSVWETVAGLCRSYTCSVPAARTHVRRFLEAGDVRFVGIGEREFDIAVEAYAHYGKGRHPAGLNMGDCFAYACARVNGAKLLFKGEDFTKDGRSDRSIGVPHLALSLGGQSVPDVLRKRVAECRVRRPGISGSQMIGCRDHAEPDPRQHRRRPAAPPRKGRLY